MNSDVKYYLDYLDKEMTIMGILSAFCVAVPSIVIERIISIDKNSVAFNVASNLTDKGIWFLILASVALFIASALFYKQRSKLAWYYGQISLEVIQKDFTECRLEEWLKDADCWKSWIPYIIAFWLSVFATIEYILTILSSIEFLVNHNNFVFFIIVPIIISLFIYYWVIRNANKYKYDKKFPYFKW